MDSQTTPKSKALLDSGFVYVPGGFDVDDALVLKMMDFGYKIRA